MAKVLAMRRIRQPIPVALWLPGLWLTLLVGAALAAPMIVPHDPLAQDLLLEKLPPFWDQRAASGHWLGTDSLGRDVFSRLVYGSRIALIVAVAAAGGACLIGTMFGLIAGFFGGHCDMVISRIVDIWMSFPPVLFSILLVAVLGTGLHSVIIAIIVIDWTRFCRVIRAETRTQTRMDYIDSARIAGFSRIAILCREVMPNVAPTIVALLSLEMGIAIIVEAILSFVGLSVASGEPSWGGMIAEGRGVIHFAWWVLVFPVLVLFFTVLSFARFGEALKQRYDPVLQ